MISTVSIPNIGSPPDDPSCLLPGILYVPDVFNGRCVIGTVADTFTGSADLLPLVEPFTDLANHGYLCLAFYVRLMTPIPTQTTDGKYHQQTDDVKIATRFMRSNPVGYNVTGWVAGLSGSAGGYDILWNALEGTTGDDKLDAAICMSPVTDMGDRSPDVTAHFITVVNKYGRSTDPVVLTSESPIAKDLANASPIYHANGDNEQMPLTQLTGFRDAMLADGALNYFWRINTGSIGRKHSFKMWPSIKDEAIAWLDAQV